jgi:hypothetical protein
MKLVSKIIVLLSIGIALGFAQATCTVDQIVSSSLVTGVSGTHWTIYNLNDPEGDVCIETDETCWTVLAGDSIFWSAEVGYAFSPPQPQVGDSLIIIGSWDSAYVNEPEDYGSNPNHTGFYWIYSDILTDVTVNHWRNDTLRPLPYPLATQVGGPTGDIQISITNPKETRYTGQTAYDVLGFWIWADTTGNGWPDSFDMEVGFASVNGGPDETTIYSHPVSNYHDEQTVYWAYKLVARPSFSLKGSRQAPGYTTHYFSHNSNPIVIIGIEENTNSKPECIKFEISPNPFTNRTDIRLQITENQMHFRNLRLFRSVS